VNPSAVESTGIHAAAGVRSALLAMAHSLLFAGYLGMTFIGTRPFGDLSPAERASGSPLDRLVALALFALSLVVIFGYREAALQRIRSNLLLYLIVGFCQISVLWSDYPDLTLRRAVLLSLLTVIATGIAAGVTDMRKFHSFLFFGLGAVVLVNLAGTALWPAQAISDIGVKGLYTQKNVAGSVAMMTLIVGVAWMARARTPVAITLGSAALLLATLFLFVSRSKTSIGLTALALAIGALFTIVQYAGHRFAILVASVALLFLMGVLCLLIYYDFDADQLFGLVLSDTSFSGRDELWSFAWKSAMQREWLGHGYGAFWDVGDANDPLAKLEPGTWLGDVEKGVINQAHNGYLELWLHVGLPATIAAVVYIIAALARATIAAVGSKTAPDDKSAFAAIALLLFTFLLHNLTEASLFMRGIQFFNLVLLVALLAPRARAKPAQGSRAAFELSSR
jgi:exopolysaccharide production protein ExoQ